MKPNYYLGLGLAFLVLAIGSIMATQATMTSEIALLCFSFVSGYALATYMAKK
jgi:hypothetical protein